MTRAGSWAILLLPALAWAGRGDEPEALDVQLGPLVLDTALGETAWPDEEAISWQIAHEIGEILHARYPKPPMRRDAHPRAHGCVHAEYRAEPDLPPELAHGVFAPGSAYDAWIRFSNGSPEPTRADIRGDVRGMAIKLTGVPGAKLLPGERATQDFVLIDHPVFFMDDPVQYLELFERTASWNPLVALTAPLALDREGARIVKEMLQIRIGNPLEERYWSETPYRLGPPGEGVAVKYQARPCGPATTPIPEDPAEHYLRHRMMETLANGDACFELLVQPRTDPGMSVERSMIEWPEDRAPFVKVATITIPAQTFTAPAQDAFCESLSFTPWHALPEHQPLGATNRVRRVVYEAISALRHAESGTPRVEPTGAERF